MDPINYNLVNPADAITSGLRLGAGLNAMDAQRQQQAQAVQQQQAMQGALHSLVSNPNAGHSDYAAVMTAYPQLAENLSKAWKVRSEGEQQNAINFGSRVYSLALAGKNEDAAAMLDQRSKADPAQAQHWNALAQVTRQSPAMAKTIGALTLSALMGDKFASAFPALAKEQRDADQAPVDLRKKVADAAKAEVEAGTAAEKIGADIAKTREEVEASKARTRQDGLKFGLDVDRFNLDFDKALEEFRQKRLNGGVQLSAGMEKLQADSVGTSIAAKTASDQAVRLADVMRKDPQAGGVWTWTAAKWRQSWGSDSPIQDLRREYVRIRNQGLLTDLPPGPASDRDIQIMKEGFPTENADGETLARWLDAYGRVQKAIAMKEEAKADWISAVGALKSAPRDIEVMGSRVPAGTSFVDFIRRSQTSDGKPAAKTGYLEKYGR